MKYTIVRRSETRESMKERTFCFACGCFQGGIDKKPVSKE